MAFHNYYVNVYLNLDHFEYGWNTKLNSAVDVFVVVLKGEDE